MYIVEFNSTNVLMETKKFISLKDLEVYQLSRKLSTIAWGIYSNFNYEQKKIIGDQFIRSVDSVGANIAEGFGRFHYMDKVKFYIYSRASLYESCQHWAELMHERKIISDHDFSNILEVHKLLEIKLNNIITNNRNKRK